MWYENKILLRVRKDKNGWYQFTKGKYRLQLCWDTRKDGFFIEQTANKLWKKNFMKDFTEILQEMSKNEETIFSLYELPDVINWQIS